MSQENLVLAAKKLHRSTGSRNSSTGLGVEGVGFTHHLIFDGLPPERHVSGFVVRDYRSCVIAEWGYGIWELKFGMYGLPLDRSCAIGDCGYGV